MTAPTVRASPPTLRPPPSNVEGYHLSNFRIGFRADDGFNLFAWVRNAFDEEYFEQIFVGPGNTGLIAGLPGDPRTWGATAAITF
jgi:iron complex outermembrane receptor protein